MRVPPRAREGGFVSAKPPSPESRARSAAPSGCPAMLAINSAGSKLALRAQTSHPRNPVDRCASRRLRGHRVLNAYQHTHAAIRPQPNLLKGYGHIPKKTPRTAHSVGRNRRRHCAAPGKRPALPAHCRQAANAPYDDEEKHASARLLYNYAVQMDYRRAWCPGGTYFFTVNLLERRVRLTANFGYQA